jgi:DNA-binding protein HU-beta/integration host factor subunit beta
MTKKDMAKGIADEMGLTHGQATEVIQRVLDGITETLCEASRLELRNFGIFEVRERKPRTARNPRTGETVQVPAKRLVNFKPGRVMAERVAHLAKAPGGATAAATPASIST